MPLTHDAVANGNEQVTLQPPQLATSVMKLKPSSTVPVQLLSMLSHASTPALVFTHSQPLFLIPSALKKFAKHVKPHTPATHVGSEFGTTHELKQVPQLEMSVWR